MGDYALIEHGSNDRLVEREAPKIISIPERKYTYSDVVDKVSISVRGLFLTEGLDHEMSVQVEHITDPDSVDNLMSGTINLINTVIDNHRQGNPVETLLFLDKSARNGAYMFSAVWQELQERGELIDGLDKPSIRFMNIGIGDDEKHHSQAPLELLKRKKYRSSDFESQRVLVVDEFVDTGGSLRRGLKTIEQVYGTVPLGLAQFKIVPPWYGRKQLGLLGVTDLEDAGERYDQIKERLDIIQPEEAARIKEIHSRVSRSRFVRLIFQIAYMSNRGHDSQSIHEIITKKGFKTALDDIETLYKTIKDAELSALDGGDVWQYIDSAGGFVARRLDRSEQRQNSRYYRRVLKAIVSSYLLERDMEEVAEQSGSTQEQG